MASPTYSIDHGTMAEPSTKSGKIFIGGLSYETTDEKLRAYFSAYGAVTDAVVMKDPISRRSRGFGFITYGDPACVDRALAQPTHILDSRRVEAKRAVPRAESARDNSNSSSRDSVSSMSSVSINSNVGATKKIFVGGLHYETKDAVFKKYFQQFGKVVSAEVMFNRETNKSRGFGFVIFENEASVEHVLQEQHHVIDSKTVEVKRAVPRRNVGPSSETPASLSETSNSSSSSDLSRAMLSPSSASYMNNSAALGGYAAAVRYGNRPVQRTPVLAGSQGLDADITTGVTDALNSLAIGEGILSAPGSGNSSIASSDRLMDQGSASGRLSPLTIVADPVMEQWNLSPSSQPQTAPKLSPSRAANYLAPQGGQPSNGAHHFPWQRSWSGHRQQQHMQHQHPAHQYQQQQYHPQYASHHDQRAQRHQEYQGGAPSPFFSMFPSDGNRDVRTSMSQSAWNPNVYAAAPSNTTDAFNNGMGMDPRNGGGAQQAFPSLGSLLHRGYAPQSEPEFPLDRALGGVLNDISEPDSERQQREYATANRAAGGAIWHS
ncbi:TPA: hypothetical protein N0F65_007113 [Lagenidium giganteum]|uniref:RRM domain-containing protein n=1 Tax=Lagenidium giganteum TaxID=4803 RepID=A0AAV2YL44_9STRA|nr:TPA: hypothetical protein N0F65_007113 [Lagenidium giganteum]